MDKPLLRNMLPSVPWRRPGFKHWRVGLVVAAVSGWSWWQVQQSRPVTPNQQVTIASLADQAARKRAVSHQRVYADLFKHLHVRRTEEITAAQYDQAMEYLIPMAR